MEIVAIILGYLLFSSVFAYLHQVRLRLKNRGILEKYEVEEGVAFGIIWPISVPIVIVWFTSNLLGIIASKLSKITYEKLKRGN